MFRYNSIKESLQKNLMFGKLENLTNTGIIKSEVEYKRYLNSTLSFLNKTNTQIFNSKDVQIKYSDLINFKTYKDNLEKIYYDLFTSYTELDTIKEFLENNLNKNKQFYKNIKDRVRNYRKYLNLLRLNTYDITTANITFFESFNDINRNYYLENCEINENSNKLYLEPMNKEVFNNSIDIDHIDLEVMPSLNEQGGVYFTHSEKNDIVKNYKNGSRTMLKDGLWKLQLLTEGVPEIYLDVNSNTKKYNGIIARMDIYFTGMKPINRLYIEPYGEFYTTILGAEYLQDGKWKPLRQYDNKTGVYKSITGEKLIFDFMNIEPVSTTAIRIIFNQENYKVLDNYMQDQMDAFSTLIKEIQENRYDYIDKINIQNKYLTRPFDSNNQKATILEQLSNIIFETNSFTETEIKIKELLFPKLKNINFNSNWKIYELGAWEITPQYAQYAQNEGTYISHNTDGYQLNKTPLQVTLNVEDETPDITSIEYFITDENESTYIPIMPVGQKVRRETNRFKIYPAMYRLKKILKIIATPDLHYNIRSNYIWYTDFPVHEEYIDKIKFYINGEVMEFGTNYANKVTMFNSRMFYMNGIEYNPNNTYMMEYIPAKNDIVECWILQQKNSDLTLSPNNFNNYGNSMVEYMTLDQYIIFSSKDVALEFLYLYDTYYKSNNSNMSNSYIIKKTYCHKNEFNLWFKNGSYSLFIDPAFMSLSNGLNATPFQVNMEITNPLKIFPFSYSYLIFGLFIAFDNKYGYNFFTKSSWLANYKNNILSYSYYNTFISMFPPYFINKANIWSNLYPSIMI